MADEQEERREIEAYLDQHNLQAFIGDAVNDIVKDRPRDPLVSLADALRASSESSKQIQKVRGRQILNGEAFPALEVEIGTSQGPAYGTISSGPFDDDDQHYQGRGVRRSVETVDHILAEIFQGKDPTQQAKLDKILLQESSLPANVVSAASIACCKAGAKQTNLSVFEFIGTMCDNSEGGIPPTAFSIINGGHRSASSLWVQDIFLVPTGDKVALSDQLLVMSTVHRTLEVTARDAGQELLQRGPRGGFCNGAGTFEHLMDCLVTSLEKSGFSDCVELIIDVHASKLVPLPTESETAGEEQREVSYDLNTFSSDKKAKELITTNALLDMYLEWLEKYPITAFIEPFDIEDVTASKELLIQGHQVLQAKTAISSGQKPDPTAGGVLSSDGQAENTENVEGSGGEEGCLLRVIADQSVSTSAQLLFVNEQRGANAFMVNSSKISTLSECIALAGRANELGWAIIVAAVSEEELEGEFIAELGVGLRAAQFLMGGLRSASTIAACARLLRIEDEGVRHVEVKHA